MTDEEVIRLTRTPDSIRAGGEKHRCGVGAKRTTGVRPADPPVAGGRLGLEMVERVGVL
jgi:hypothetical protein